MSLDGIPAAQSLLNDVKAWDDLQRCNLLNVCIAKKVKETEFFQSLCRKGPNAFAFLIQIATSIRTGESVTTTTLKNPPASHCRNGRIHYPKYQSSTTRVRNKSANKKGRKRIPCYT